MSRAPLHALIWSKEQSLYEFYTQSQFQQRFRPAEEAAWQVWLREVTSFAFHGTRGSLNVYQEARSRGRQYWYAYHTTRGHTRKRYLGSSVQMTFARLEETAEALAREPVPPPLAASRMREAAEQPLLLLASRLTPPRLPSSLVPRERLLAALDGGLATPLTLLSAATGWGKTTLLSAWTSQHKGRVARLELSELDNSATRFWVALIAALRRGARYAPSLGETAMALLQSPQPPPLSTILTALLNENELLRIDIGSME